MSRRFERYRATEETKATAEFFNQIHEDLDIRVHGVEEKASGWDEVVTQFEEVGLARLEEALAPIYTQVANAADSISELIQSGTVFTVSSLSAATPGTGEKVFVVDSTKKGIFTPAAYMMAFKADDPTVFMTGYLISYNRATGELHLLVDRFAGASEIASWTITPCVEIIPLQEALTYRDEAESAATTAQGWATAAATSASNAATSQAGAASSAGTASAAVSSIQSYTSQAIAARDSAQGQATAAASSASAAAAAQATVQNLVDSINNTYLGEFTTDPLAGNGGAPLQPGMLYYNTIQEVTKVYTAFGWVSLSSSQFLAVAGGAMEGPLTLAGSPTTSNEASTKKYVDDTAYLLSLIL